MLLQANKERAAQFFNVGVFGGAFPTLIWLDKQAGRSG